jgi:hypothetical protein
MHKSAQYIENPHTHDRVDILERQVEEQHHMLTKILAPAISRVKVMHNEMIAEVRITQAGLALLQYIQSRENLPDTLETLKLQNINDPFSELPLHYKSQEQGFILYSVGPDKKDNDGSPRQKKQKDDWDIVWSYTGGS